MSCCMLVSLMCCWSESQKITYSQVMLTWLNVYLQLKIGKFLVQYFCAAQSDLIPYRDTKGLFIWQFSSHCLIQVRSILLRVPSSNYTKKCSQMFYWIKFSVLRECIQRTYNGKSLLLSASCYLPIQTVSQVVLWDSSNFLWISIFILWFAEVQWHNLLFLSSKTVCPPSAPFSKRLK